MTDTEIIAKQAKQIYELDEQLTAMLEAAREIRTQIVGCGGPLNDNFLGYSREQMGPFARILDLVGHHD